MLRVLWPGRTKDPLLSQLVRRYSERIHHYVPFRLEETTTPRGHRPSVAAETEGKRLLSRLGPETRVIILDAEGDEMSSQVFSKWLESRLSAGGPAGLAFLLGGHQGLSRAVKARATQALSLSRMTLTHEMVRVLFLEQLYRAFTIIRGESYHH